MTTIQLLYNKLKSETLTKNQFLNEINKYPQFRGHFSNSNTFNDIIKILKRKQLIVENMLQPSYQQNRIEPINFNTDDTKDVHIIKCEIPNSVQFIHNDTLRQVEPDAVQSFIDVTYDGNTEDKDDLEIVTDFLMHHKAELEQFAQVDAISLEELDGMKQNSPKVVKIADKLNEDISYDNVSSHEYNMGFNIENDACKDAIQASKKVLKNLESNPKYYSDLISKHKDKLNLRPQKVKDDTMVDKLNPMVKIKAKAINEATSTNPNLNQNYQYHTKPTDHTTDPKLERMVKKHFDEVVAYAKKFKYVKTSESINSLNRLFMLKFKKGKNLLTYNILQDLELDDDVKVAYTVVFNGDKFEYNNIKDAYKQFKTLVETGESVETPQSSDGNIVTDRDSSNMVQLMNSQYTLFKDIADKNGYILKKSKDDTGVSLEFRANDPNGYIEYCFRENGFLVYHKILSTGERVNKEFTKLYQANKYVIELLTSKKVKGDKTVKEPLVKDIDSEIKGTDKFNKLFDTIVAYKSSNDKGYTRLINFLTGELYKNKDIKNLIDLDYNGDTSQIKNIINNHFTKK